MKIAVIGASGYTGGELLRLLYIHPDIEIHMITSRTYVDQPVGQIHPNLKKLLDVKFTSFNMDKIGSCDFIFLAVPHKASQAIVPDLLEIGLKIVDLSADFRLKDMNEFEKHYGTHSCPEITKEAVYGLPELHREEIKKARLVAAPGCMACATILALAPLFSEPDLVDPSHVISDAKIGSSGGGKSFNIATHHPERTNVIRPYRPVGHRHLAEIVQELNLISNKPIKVGFSAHGVNIVRGILSTSHVFPIKDLTEKDLWRLYRKFYKDHPFVRIIKQKSGLYRRPDPKMLIGSNFCDVGFDIDPEMNRIVTFGALDNLVKGAAGSAIQCFNLMTGLDETKGLWYPALHPI
ncbi:MAG: N-acetyl-gamma-glutamyl-phosphate reductase [Candidatus Helarchaeota archaeon]